MICGYFLSLFLVISERGSALQPLRFCNWYLGAGKHPSPLDISESYSPHLYLKVGFYLIKKYCSCPKLSQFKDRAFLWLVPAPIYTCCDVSDDIYLGAGKHPSPLDISESYSPDLYLKVGFYLIKKYCSCPKLSQFKDRAFLWLVPAPIYTCCDVSDDIHIYTWYRDNDRWHFWKRVIDYNFQDRITI